MTLAVAIPLFTFSFTVHRSHWLRPQFYSLRVSLNSVCVCVGVCLCMCGCVCLLLVDRDVVMSPWPMQLWG